MPLGLIFVGLVPVVAGSARVVQLAGDADVTATTASYLPSAAPLVVHIVSGILFSLLGALQFSAALRRRRAWHRIAGRLVVPTGLTAAGSAIWMTAQYSPSTLAGVLLFGLRMLFGTLMVASLVVGFAAIRRGQVRRHRIWMTRAYAIGLGAGTQAFTIGLGQAAFGKSALSHAVLSGVAWVINLAVAEWSINRSRARSRRSAVSVAGVQ